MITIAPHNCTVSPAEHVLPHTFTLRFSARSSEPGGETATVIYDLGGSTVLIDGAPGNRLAVQKRIGSGATEVVQPVTLRAMPGQTPCGDLRITVLVELPGSGFQVQVLCHIRIPC